MTGRHRGGRARRGRLAGTLLAALGWGYTGRHRLAPARPTWSTPRGMSAPAAPVAPVRLGPALPTSRQSLAPRLSVVTVAHRGDLAVAAVLTNSILADVAVYARLDAEREAAVTAALARPGEQARSVA